MTSFDDLTHKLIRFIQSLAIIVQVFSMIYLITGDRRAYIEMPRPQDDLFLEVALTVTRRLMNGIQVLIKWLAVLPVPDITNTCL